MYIVYMRKNIDIPDDQVERLKLEAVKNGLSFKKYLEHKILETGFVHPTHASLKKTKVSSVTTTTSTKNTCQFCSGKHGKEMTCKQYLNE